jgi:hypothetical protein
MLSIKSREQLQNMIGKELGEAKNGLKLKVKKKPMKSSQ